MPSSKDKKEPLSELARHVRAQDPDRFYASLFASEAKREALFALLAFDHEIARVRGLVSQPAAGEMRLQWWRDVLTSIEAGGDVAHPVASALASAHRAEHFPLQPLHDLIEAHAADLYEPATDAAARERFATATGGNLHRVLAAVLGANETQAQAAGHAGTAWALAQMLRMRPAEEKANNAAEIQELARRHYALARQSKAGPALPASLAAALVPSYAGKNAAADETVGTRMELSAPHRLLRLLWAATRGRI